MIAELYHLLDDDSQNQIAQMTCVISKEASDYADSAQQSIDCWRNLSTLCLPSASDGQSKKNKRYPKMVKL